MVDEQQTDSYDADNPSASAQDAMVEATSQLVDVHESAENAAVAGIEEQNAVSPFVETVARALTDGMNKSIGSLSGPVAEEAKFHTKTDLKQQIKDKAEEFRNDGKQPLCQFVEDRCAKVAVVKTTDHKQGAQYIFDFGTFKVETKSGKDGRGHYNWSNFRDYILESGGVNLSPPEKDRRGGEEWRDFITTIIEKRGETRRTVGRRTEAVERLQKRLSNQTGYGTAIGAVDHSGIWIVRQSADVPGWWAALSDTGAGEDVDLTEESVEQVRVHESLIKPILDDIEISRQALYHELEARNHIAIGQSGASMTEWVAGNNERFWALAPDIGVPRTYIADANAPDSAPSPFAIGEQNEEQAAAEAAPGDDSARDTGGFDSVGDTA